MRNVVAIMILGIATLACGSGQTPGSSAIYTQAVQTALAGLALTTQPGAAGQVAPTVAPLPTNRPTLPPPTLEPTANPNIVEAGTHVIGKDMMPGLYQGRAGTDSCYWARLKDLLGGLDSILANSNSEGQFYIRVRDGDYALETHCPLLLLAGAPQPLAQMPTQLTEGMYLVGIDMQPGTYEGQAGNDSCYWARLSDVDGDLNSILANDNAKGQFYVQVSPSDYALEVSCDIERIGQ